MKKGIKRLLKKYNLYSDLRYSWMFRFYQYLFKPKDILAEKKEIQFYKSFLSPCDLIFDIGAYDGHKTAAFLNIAKKVVACEPDPQNFVVLTSRFRNKKKKSVPGEQSDS